MVNPGAFQGQRKEFLLSVKPAYANAVKDGYAAEEVANIQRRYFKRFPLDLPHDQEPTEEHLAAVDDDAVDPDAHEPDPSKLTAEEYGAALEALEKRQKLIEFRKAQIKRWLAYQYMKDNDADPKETGAHNPYRVLLCKLTGKEISRPRSKTACNVWRKTKRDIIEEKAKALASTSGVPKSGLAALRDKVAREMFNKLSDAEKKHWQQQAEKESKATIEAWEAETKSGPSTLPEDRQRCIHGVVRFMQPILDMVCEATGWKATCILGGPEPADEGRLNMLSFHSGKTTGDIPLDFGQVERERIKKQIVPIFGSFLKKCYSPEECRSYSLNPDGGLLPLQSIMQSMEQGNGATIHSLESGDCSSYSERAESVRGGSSSARPSSNSSASESVALEGPVDASNPAASNRPANPDVHNPTTHESSPNQAPISAHSTSPPDHPPLSSGGADLGTAPASTAAEGPHSPPAGRICNSGEETSAASQQDCPPSRLGSPVRSPRHSPSREFSPRPPRPAAVSTPRPAAQSQNSLAASGPNPVDQSTTADPASPPSSTSSTPPSEGFPPAAPDLSIGKRIRGLRSTSSVGGERPNKRRRTRTSAGSSTSTACSIDDISLPPVWFRAALEMFKARGLQDDLQWGELLEKWTLFEAQESYECETKLGAAGRPPEIGAWIQRARISRFQPPIADISSYADNFCRWWASLQPEWRLSEGNVAFDRVEGDWGCLKKGGQNGILSAICGLFFWGSVLKSRPKRPGSGAEQELKQDLAQWQAAVDDCILVLKQMLDSA